MDVAEKHPGITHLALRVSSIAATERLLASAGIAESGRRGADPVRSIFVRDPDRNVIELSID